VNGASSTHDRLCMAPRLITVGLRSVTHRRQPLRQGAPPTGGAAFLRAIHIRRKIANLVIADAS